MCIKVSMPGSVRCAGIECCVCNDPDGNEQLPACISLILWHVHTDIYAKASALLWCLIALSPTIQILASNCLHTYAYNVAYAYIASCQSCYSVVDCTAVSDSVSDTALSRGYCSIVG